jgi:hypothetical protein
MSESNLELVMRSLRPMPLELVARLFAFKNDKRRWSEFARRKSFFLEHGTEEPPGRGEIVEEFVREKLGENHGYWVADVLIKIPTCVVSILGCVLMNRNRWA